MKHISPLASPRAYTRFELTRQRLLFTSGELSSNRRVGKLGLAGIQTSKKLLKKIEGPFAVYYQQQDDGSYAKVCTRKSPSPVSTSPLESPLRAEAAFHTIKAAELLSRYQTHLKTLSEDVHRQHDRQPDRQLTILTPVACDSPKRKLFKRSLSQNLQSHRAKTSQLRLSLDYLSTQCLSIKDSVKTSSSSLSSYRNELSERLKLLTKKIETPMPNPYRDNLHTAYTSKVNLFKRKGRRQKS
mmetsp:Transcript_20969/g.38836  ORF Transcript_20969/g.38836 Transcript_20969/m.38836 type:complete len:242 (-) Transcript_20969:252-977(-)